MKYIFCLGVPALIQIVDVFMKEGSGRHSLYIVTEMWGQDLWALLNVRRKLEPAEVRQACKSILQGLLHLHVSLGIAHTDVKPANIQVRTDVSNKAPGLECKLADLGSAVQVGDLIVFAAAAHCQLD